MLEKIKKNKNLIIGSMVILVVGVFFLFRGEKSVEKEYMVSKLDLKEEVSITGKVKPSKKVDLSFDKSGRVGTVYKDVGDHVSAGEIIIFLSAGDVRANLLQAEASLDAEKAKLEEYKQGTRPEELAIASAKVLSAEKALADAQKNLIDQISDAYTKSDDAIRYKADQIFSNPRSPNPQVYVSVADGNLERELEDGRLELEGILISWQEIVSKINADNSLNSSNDVSNKNIAKVRSFMDKVSFLVNNLVPNTGYTQTTIDSWKSTVSTGRTNVNTAVNNLSSATEKLKTAESNLTSYRLELDLKKAGYTKEQIAAQEAKVKAAEANVLSYEAELAKTIIRAPISGIVTKMDAKIGETVSVNVAVASIIGESKFEIESNVTEVDIGKIKVGDSAKITLDAYGDNVVFDVAVSKIDPAEIVIDNIPTYKVTLQFAKSDERVRSGMTANIDVLTKEKKGTLSLPREAVFEHEGKQFVMFKNENGSVAEKEVKTGIRDSNGNIEILEGLKEGDKIIVPASE